MIKAGALRQLCHYYESLGGKPAFWGEVRAYALREFRDIAIEVIEDLIRECVKARCLAEECNNETE